MGSHRVWHVIVLAGTLFGSAGALMLMLAPVLFDEVPKGFARARPVVVGLVVAAGLLLLWEWQVVH
jgi:hypothetical protein